jgi:hypothetical protein
VLKVASQAFRLIPMGEGRFSFENPLVLRQGRLVLTGLRIKDIALTPENRKTFVGDGAGFELVTFLTGADSEVIGFELESDFLRGLVFRKE